VLQIVIRGHGRANALDTNIHRELAEIWRDIDSDPETRAVVVRGSDDAFSAGGDVGMVEAMGNDWNTMAVGWKEARDIVYMPEYTTFWAMSRYLVGPQWGDPLAVQDPVNQDRSEIWPKIYQRLGPQRLELLHLKPLTRRVDGFKVPLFIGWSPLPEVAIAQSVWIVGGPELQLAELELCRHDVPPTAQFVRVLTYRITCKPGESAVLTPPAATH